EDPVEAELWPRFVKVLEEAPASVEQHRRQRHLQFLNYTQVQVLLDDVCSTRDTNVPAACCAPRQLERALGSLRDEVERSPTGTRPWFTCVMGEHVDRCVERRLFWPGPLALLEHPHAHDVGADPLAGAADEIVDRARLSSRPEVEVVSEVLLVEDPRHQGTPLGPPVLELGRVPVLEAHPLWRHVTIEAECDVDEDLAHTAPLSPLTRRCVCS